MSEEKKQKKAAEQNAGAPADLTPEAERKSNSAKADEYLCGIIAPL